MNSYEFLEYKNEVKVKKNFFFLQCTWHTVILHVLGVSKKLKKLFFFKFFFKFGFFYEKGGDLQIFKKFFFLFLSSS
jgi:hypothetical protein